MEYVVKKKRKLWKWYGSQERERKRLGLEQSFRNFQFLLKVRDRLNNSNFQSEVEAAKRIRHFCRSNKLDIIFYQNLPILNKYFADFASIDHKIVLEIDGSIHNTASVRQKDTLKDFHLKEAKWTVFRVKFPSFEGLDEFFNHISQFKQTEKPKPKPNKSFRPKNGPLVGTTRDSSVIQALKKKQRKLEKIRQDYIKNGIDPDKMLGTKAPRVKLRKSPANKLIDLFL